VSSVLNVSDGTATLDWRRLLRQKEWPALPVAAPFSIVDLFAGCGGLTLGAVLAACKVGRRPIVRLAVDNWRQAIDVYAHNFEGIAQEIACTDVLGVVERSVPNLDLLVAGPPCQGHSDLNNSTRRNDPRNELYLAPAHFAVQNKPKLVLIENVPAVVHSSQNVVGRARELLRLAGYACFDGVFDVSQLGIPQRRRRHLLVGVIGEEERSLHCQLAPLGVGARSPKVFDFLDDLQDRIDSSDAMFATTRVSKENSSRIAYLFAKGLYDLPDELRPPCHRNKAHSYASMYGRIRPDAPAQTITSGFGSMGQGRFVHPTRPRMITPREAARIQGFPDYFSFASVSSRTALREMIANAVPPALSAAVVSTLASR
jgi:DNA (cytosine-5)-methyltransferase 1